MLELLTAAVTESPIFSFSEANVLTLGFSGSQRGASGHLQLKECPGLNMWSLTKGPLLGPSGNSHFLPCKRTVARGTWFTAILRG